MNAYIKIATAIALFFVILSCGGKSVGRNEERVFDPSPVTYPLTITNGEHELVIESEPQRILSLTLASDEILLALKEPDELLGVSYTATNEDFSNVPELAEMVAHRIRPDAELIFSLKPDVLFIAPYVSADFRHVARKELDSIYSITAFQTIGDIEANIYAIASIVNERERGLALIENMRSRLLAVTENHPAPREKKRVLFLSTYGYTAGAGTSFDEAVRLAGAVNAADTLGVRGHAKIDDELLIGFTDVDVVVISEADNALAREIITNDARYQDLDAIKNNAVITIAPKTMSSISQYFVDGVVELHYALYGDDE